MLEKMEDAWLTFQGRQLNSNFLRDSQFFSPEQMHAYQVQHLKDILQTAEKYLPYYRKLFWDHDFDTSRFKELEQLRVLPILKKQEVLEHRDEFYCFELMKDSLSLQTSGTTGQPFKVYISKAQWAMEQAVIWRHWGWANYHFRDRMAVVRSYSPEPGQPLYRLDRLRNWMYFSPYHLSENNILDYLRVMQKWKPKFLRGYPSSLHLLAQVALDHGIELPSLKGALTASETLQNHHREALRQAFSIEVFDHYGQAEITAMMHECEQHKGLHIDSEYGYVELIPTDEANVHKLVATNLHNKVMPLIRYETGDLVVHDGSSCSCQRTLPLVQSVRGRQDEMLFHAKGYPLPTVQFYTYFAKQQEVYRFQLIQWSRDKVECRLQLRPHASETRVARGVSENLSERFGMAVVINMTSKFETSGGGKCLPIIQKVKPETHSTRKAPSAIS
jgi:phenylacetate-CoA ligase